jgi:hypothetical protein
VLFLYFALALFFWSLKLFSFSTFCRNNKVFFVLAAFFFLSTFLITTTTRAGTFIFFRTYTHTYILSFSLPFFFFSAGFTRGRQLSFVPSSLSCCLLVLFFFISSVIIRIHQNMIFEKKQSGIYFSVSLSKPGITNAIPPLKELYY